MPRAEVIAYIIENSGKLFDPNLIDAFMSVIEKEPPNII